MSRKKRALDKQKKQNSPAQKAKRAKNIYYASSAARENWEEKKKRKHQSQLNRRESEGVSVDCPLPSWDKPSEQKCKDCHLRCAFRVQ